MLRITIGASAFASFILFFAAGTAAAQQSAVASAGLPPVPADTAGANPAPGSAPQLEQRYPRYKMQNQDVLRLSFPLTPELNQTVTVQPDGYINLQNAGSLYVQGLTVPELTAAVKKAYAGTLHDPIVDVDLTDFQKPFFTVSGQVGKPGQYTLRQNLTVAEAVAVAGGLAPTAKTQIFVFHKTSNDQFVVKKLNLKDVLNGKNVNEDPTIQPGDMVYVPEKFIANFKKYFPYSVEGGTYFGQF